MANGTTDARNLCKYRSGLGIEVHVGRYESCFTVYKDPVSDPIGTIAMPYEKEAVVGDGGRIKWRWSFKLKDMIYGSVLVVAELEEIIRKYMTERRGALKRI